MSNFNEYNSYIHAELPQYEHPPQWIPIEYTWNRPRDDIRQGIFRAGADGYNEAKLSCIHPRTQGKCLAGYHPERRGDPNYDNDIRKFLPRFVKLKRSRSNDALGFNIRGGKEHLCGIFISKVLPNTEAQHLGLQEGDEILKVNDTPFEDIDHAQAVRILKQNTDVELIVRYFPYGYQKTYEKTKVSNQSPHGR